MRPAFASPLQLQVSPVPQAQSLAPQSSLTASSKTMAVAVAAVVAGSQGARRKATRRLATVVEAETTTDLAPWEIDEETEEERQDRYTREADEMKLKWDARRLEERQSAQRRQAQSQREQERACLYGPRDLVMEAYEARMYEEARVIEVRRRQREVYERIKASKEGKPLQPKGKPYVELKPPPKMPPPPEKFNVTGHYDPEPDIEAKKYKAPASYVSPTGPAPPPRSERGTPRAAWETPLYDPPRRGGNANWPEPGSLPASTVPSVRAGIEKQRAEHAAKPRRFPVPDDGMAGIGAPRPGPHSGAQVTEDTVAEDDDDDDEDDVLEEASGAAASILNFKKDEVEAMTVPELKAALTEAGMPATGKKADLRDRLLAAI